MPAFLFSGGPRMKPERKAAFSRIYRKITAVLEDEEAESEDLIISALASVIVAYMAIIGPRKREYVARRLGEDLLPRANLAAEYLAQTEPVHTN
jgi:hypothetical protein